MNIFAITKTFRGHEFAAASLASVYPYISGVLYVHEDTGWMGRKGNTVRDVIKQAPDPDHKIYHLDLHGQVSQDDQYNAAVEWLETNKIKYDYLLLVDTDEIWTPEDYDLVEFELEYLLKYQYKSQLNSIRCRLYDYVKSPFFRVDPPGRYRQTNFVLKRAVKKGALNLRGCYVKPGKELDTVFWHHFPMVRMTLTEVVEKQIDSCGIERVPIVDMENWVKTIWNQLPDAVNLCPLADVPGYWSGIKVVGIENLPVAVRNHPIVLAWQKYPKEKYPYKDTPKATPELLKKHGLPPDFGPRHPSWKIPSKRNRFERAVKELMEAKK